MTPSFDLETMMKVRISPGYYAPDCSDRWRISAASMLAATGGTGEPRKKKIFIDKIIFNGPATIVYWDDGTKTAVKCKPDDPYSKDVGVAMATLKKILGSGYGRYLTAVRKHIEKAK